MQSTEQLVLDLSSPDLRENALLKLSKHPPAIFPRIVGHEAMGIVESVGEGVHEVVEGDNVIPIFLVRRNKQIHRHQWRNFSEYTVVDIAHVTKYVPATPPNRDCLLSCGVSTGVGAVWKTANVEVGSKVAIFGYKCFHSLKVATEFKRNIIPLWYLIANTPPSCCFWS
ncbi:unnamed protein product [Lactuca saligna]|uniref:Alcohol dehydrogenase-like N-terminal domain-containing protein n=1 Tax=Lactuca saligna TaxID=75948 RepID=A0AA35ZZA5_LACSI|nr:unnamed protein product [Lactuca saligna]